MNKKMINPYNVTIIVYFVYKIVSFNNFVIYFKTLPETCVFKLLYKYNNNKYQ